MWTFTDRVTPSRATQLLSWRSFGEILSRVPNTAVANFNWERGIAKHLTRYHRASYLLELPTDLYDALFNSPYGLRAQYARSPRIGEEATRQLINLLFSRLLAFARARGNNPTEDLVRTSLTGPEAKFWIYEPEVKDMLASEVPEINFALWHAADESGVGLLAPVGKWWEIKGNWVDENGSLVPNPDKAARSAEIHQFGFS